MSGNCNQLSVINRFSMSGGNRDAGGCNRSEYWGWVRRGHNQLLVQDVVRLFLSVVRIIVSVCRAVMFGSESVGGNVEVVLTSKWSS